MHKAKKKQKFEVRKAEHGFFKVIMKPGPMLIPYRFKTKADAQQWIDEGGARKWLTKRLRVWK
jgi:hypothetical protein